MGVRLHYTLVYRLVVFPISTYVFRVMNFRAFVLLGPTGSQVRHEF